MSDDLGTPAPDVSPEPVPVPADPVPVPIPVDGAPVPIPVDGAPAPLPLGVPVKRRRRWPFVVGGIVLLAIAAGCVWGAYLLGNALDESMYGPTDEWVATPQPSYAYPGSSLVAWSGAGRYAVIQSFDNENVPLVVVWDAETDTTRTEAGYVVVGVESEGAQIWLEPRDEVLDVCDLFSDVIDHQPERLLAWRLDEDGGPTDVASAKWRAWPGPGGYTAYLELDPLRGCMPAKLLINNNEGSGEGVKAALPEDTRTFSPVGWSPSGEYFAVEELVDGDENGLLSTEWVYGSDEPEFPARRLLVFSAVSGELVAEAGLPVSTMSLPTAAWGDTDVLYWVDTDALAGSPDGYGQPEVCSLDTSGSEYDVPLGVDDLSDIWSASLLGSDARGVLLYSDDGRLWRISAEGVEHGGNLDWIESGDWDPRGGLLSARSDYGMDDESTYAAAFVSSEYGGKETRIWRGPAIDFGVDVSF